MSVRLRLRRVYVGRRGSVAVFMSFVGLAAMVVVSFAPFVELLCQDGAWNCSGMLEHQSPAVIRGGKQDAEATQRENQQERPLTTPHPPLSQNAPQGEYGKHSQRNQCQLLVGFHHLMHRLTMLDTILGLQA